MLTDTVADEVTDDSAAERFGIGLHGMPDIRDPASLAREFHALEKALLRDINKPLRFGRDFPAGIGCGAVPMESLPFGSDIDGDNVTLLQHAAVRNAVNDGIVHGNTDARGVAGVVQEGRCCTL